MTPKQLCREIDRLLELMPKDNKDQVTRTYRTTYSLVYLNRLKLANPTKASFNRLDDLHKSVKAELDSLGIVFSGKE